MKSITDLSALEALTENEKAAVLRSLSHPCGFVAVEGTDHEPNHSVVCFRRSYQYCFIDFWKGDPISMCDYIGRKCFSGNIRWAIRDTHDLTEIEQLLKAGFMMTAVLSGDRIRLAMSRASWHDTSGASSP